MHDIDVIANIVVIIGFWLLPLTWWRLLSPSPHIMLSGMVLFVTSGFSRLADLAGADNQKLTVVNHVVQAVAITWFVLGFWRLMRQAHRLLAEAQGLADREEGR